MCECVRGGRVNGFGNWGGEGFGTREIRTRVGHCFEQLVLGIQCGAGLENMVGYVLIDLIQNYGSSDWQWPLFHIE